MYRTAAHLNAEGARGVLRGMLTLAALLSLSFASPSLPAIAGPCADNPDGGQKKKKKKDGDDKEEEYRLTLRFDVVSP